MGEKTDQNWSALSTGKRLWYLGLLLFMGGAWGLQFSMIKLATLEGYGEMSVLFIGLVLISIVYIILSVIRRAQFRLNRERLLFLTIISLLGYTIPLLAAVYAAPHVPAGIMTLLVSLTPVVTVATALLLRTEAVSLRRLTAIMIGAIAVVIVLTPQFEVPDTSIGWWMVVMLLVPLTYGVESIYVSACWPEGLDVLQVGTGETLIATAMVLPLFLVWGEVPAVTSWGAGETGIALFALSGVLDILLYFYIIQKTGGVFVSFGMFVSLFAGLAWGMVIFSEQHGSAVWIAVTLLVLALALVLKDSGDAQHG